LTKVQDYSRLIWDLPQIERNAFLGLARDGLLRLAERIGHFEPPFEYLKTVRGPFSPEIRFILEECLRGNELALAARESFLRIERLRCATEPSAEPVGDAVPRFFTERAADYQRFLGEAYPWKGRMRGGDPRAFERDPELDAYLTAAVTENLRVFGFRRLARSFKSTILSRPLEIRWDKGMWGMQILVKLEVPTLAHSERIGLPFCGSSGSFDCAVAFNVEAQLNTFFVEYGKIFSDVLEALSNGIALQEEWLAARAA